MRRDIVADQAAQEQTALYEQFLDALHGTVLALKASGTEVTPKLVNRAISEFNKRAVQLQRWLEDYSHDIVGDYVVNGLPDDIYEAWLGEPERDFWFNFSRCLSSNRSAFVSAIRFGSAFNGLSDLLDNMHGAVGYLVGFLIIPLLCLLTEKLISENVIVQIITMIVGLALCYAFGTVWFIKVYTDTKGDMTIANALKFCVFPFVIWDLAKLALAVAMSAAVKKRVRI